MENLITCEKCNGIGRQFHDIDTEEGWPKEAEFECDDCDGTGQAQGPEYCQNCNEELRYDEHITCKACIDGAEEDMEFNRWGPRAE